MKITIPFIAVMLVHASALPAEPPVIVDAGDVTTETVAFGDLNLASESGQAGLKARIRAAAARVCLNSNPEPLSARLDNQSCARRAMTEAYRQMDRLVLAKARGASTTVATIAISGN